MLSKIAVVAGAVAFFLASPSDTPHFWPDNVESRIIDTSRIDVQVYHAGNVGMPIVVMQDMHNYFDPDPGWSDPEENAAWIRTGAGHRNFVSRLGENYRVLVPIRRGYGLTEDPGKGYDAATTGRDILAMLDALDIERAVFVGRTPSQNEMLWLAENHPERMAGMILLEGVPQPLIDVSDPAVFAFASGWWRGARDLGDNDERIDQLTMGRLDGYVPAFLTDPERRIAVPTLYLAGSEDFEGKWMWSNLYRFERAETKCESATQTYPCSVFGDPQRVARLDEVFSDHPMEALIGSARDRMKRQFSNFEVSPAPQGHEQVEDIWGDYYERIQPFLRRLEVEFKASG